MRRFSLPMLLVGICLLPVGIGSGMSAHSHAMAGLDGALANTASAEVQLLEDYFSRAQSIDLLTANNPAFRDFYDLPGSRAAKVRSGGPVLDKVNRALGYLEQLFPASIGEACFIDRDGPENARMVRRGPRHRREPVPRRVGRPVLRADVRAAPRAGLPGHAVRVARHQGMGDLQLHPHADQRRRQTGDPPL